MNRTQTSNSAVATAPDWKGFLYQFTQDIYDTFGDIQLEGGVHSDFKETSPTSGCMTLRYIDGEGSENPLFEMVVWRRYYDNNMVRLKNTETGQIIYVLADPEAVLAIIAF